MESTSLSDSDLKKILAENEALKKELASLRPLKHVVQELPVPIYMVDPGTGLYLFGNKAMDQLMGKHLSAGENRTTIAENLVAYEEKTGRKMTLEEYPSSRAMRGETVRDYQFIWRIHSRDHHVSATATVIPEAHGNPEAIMVAVTDITDQVKARQQIEMAERLAKEGYEQLQGFFMQAHIPMVILDGPEHRFALANPPYEKFIGRSASGKTLAEVFSDNEVEIYRPILDEVYQTGRPFVGKELPLNLPDEKGNIQNLFINIDYHPFKDIHGNIKGILAILIDVTEQIQTRKRIEESAIELSIEKSKLDALVEKSPSAIGLMRGPDLVFEIANHKWRELVSHDRSYLGRTYAEIYPELVGTEAIKSIQHTFATGEPFTAIEMKLRVNSPAGIVEDQYYNYTNVRVADAEGNPYGVFCYALNVSDQVKNRSELEDHRKELAISVSNLERERELRERFVLALTHDLRTPLTALKMSAQLLGRKPNDPGFVLTLAKRISDSVDRSDRMITDLLDANRIKAGEGFALQIGQTDLVEGIQNALIDLNSIHEGRFQFYCESDSVVGYWDRDSIRRAVENLASNAVKYGDRQAPVTIRLLKLPQKIEIAVHNEGPPISPSDQENIFSQFIRSDTATIGGEIGWGVGLTLVKGIVESHGGSVTIESSENKGTTFFIKLPLDSRKKHDQ